MTTIKAKPPRVRLVKPSAGRMFSRLYGITFTCVCCGGGVEKERQRQRQKRSSWWWKKSERKRVRETSRVGKGETPITRMRLRRSRLLFGGGRLHLYCCRCRACEWGRVGETLTDGRQIRNVIFFKFVFFTAFYVFITQLLPYTTRARV